MLSLPPATSINTRSNSLLAANAVSATDSNGTGDNPIKKTNLSIFLEEARNESDQLAPGNQKNGSLFKSLATSAVG